MRERMNAPAFFMRKQHTKQNRPKIVYITIPLLSACGKEIYTLIQSVLL